jgi:hypothetical protein
MEVRDMVGFEKEDVRALLSEKVEKWKSFFSTREHPCPSSLTNDEIDDVLATVAGTKPAATMTVHQPNSSSDVLSHDASLDDIFDFAASHGVKWSIVDETTESKTYLFFRTREQEIKYLYNSKMLDQFNVFNPSDIEYIISFEQQNMQALGHNEDAINDAALARSTHLIRNAHPLSESQTLVLKQVKSSDWINRIKNKDANKIDLI